MSLSPADMSMLTKLMGMTTSSSDGEALTAMRKANELLARNKIAWAEVLQAKAIPGWSMPPNRTPTRAYAEKAKERKSPSGGYDEIAHMFDVILENTKEGSFRDFVLDVQKKYRQYGRLTPRQEDAITKAYDTAMERT